MQTIHSKVNPRLLKKADRFFTGELTGRVIEILQNARRAGATKVEITNRAGEVFIRDNGPGIEDFASLLDLGGSQWHSQLEASEDPAGVGIFCLAPRKLTLRSRGRRATIEGDGWYGKPVEVHDEPDESSSSGSSGGTELRFADDPWTKALVEPHAVFTGLEVIVNGEPCAQEPFIYGESVHPPELGCRVKIVRSRSLPDWHKRFAHKGLFGAGILVNFHGQIVEVDQRPIGERGYTCLVDLTGEPTGLRLMLPARTRVIENDAFAQLLAALELETYRCIATQEAHDLPYGKYQRAHELGVDLSEATPSYRVGLLCANEIDPDPCEVQKPPDLPLDRCYRLSPKAIRNNDCAEANAHLLAALGEPEAPFVPVTIAERFDGYSWTDLERIESVTIETGSILHVGFVWSEEFLCVDSIVISAQTSDGKVFRSKAPMAVSDEGVYVTPDARTQLTSDQIWYHLGGYWEEGDTYETQQSKFEEELNAFWRHLLGPDEHVRSQMVEAANRLGENWREVMIERTGRVRIAFSDGTNRVLAPRAAV